MIVQPRTGIRVHQHLSTHKYHNTRSDRDTAPMAVRKGAGAALVLAALSFGSGRSWLGGGRYLLENQLVRVQKTRKGNLMRQQTQICFPPDAAVLPPRPLAATAVPN